MSEASDSDDVVNADIYVNEMFEKTDVNNAGSVMTIEGLDIHAADTEIGTTLDTSEPFNIHQSMSILIEEYGNTQAEDILKQAVLMKTLHDRDKLNCTINEYNKNELKRKIIRDYSDKQAETILKEAFLINVILDKDKVKPEMNNFANDTLLVPVLPNAQGKRRETKKPGCDSYLLEKLLDSNADTSDENMFDGFEDIREGTGPGINKQLEEIQIGDDSLSVSPKDLQPETREEKIHIPETRFDHDDLKAQTNIDDAFGDNLLQPIKEDHESEVYVNEGEGLTCVQKVVDADENGKSIAMDVESQDYKLEGVNGAESGDEMSSKEEETSITTDTDDDDDDDVDGDDDKDAQTMTYRQRKNIVMAVRTGNIDRLEYLLEKKNATMDMLWYKENLLMVAIRAEQEQMCQFLIDNGIDVKFHCTSLDNKEVRVMKIYSTTPREMAYERGMMSIVELLDLQDNNAFGFIKPHDRIVRLRRPKPPTPPPPKEQYSGDDLSCDEDGDVDKRSDAKDAKKQIEHGERHGNEMNMETGLHSVHTMNEREKCAIMDNDSVHGRGSHTPHSVADTSVFGSQRQSDGYNEQCMDEGYETTSPISPMCVPTFKHERNIVGTRDCVSLRGTRASNSIKMVTNRNINTVKSYKDNRENVRMHSVGCYDMESRRWHRSQSAPTRNRTSCQSESSSEIVRLGSPFLHGANKKTRNRNNSNSSQPGVRNVMSPYSQVARLLSDSQHPLLRSSGPLLPTINHDHVIRPKSQPARKSSFSAYSNRNIDSPNERITYVGYPRTPTPPGMGLNKELLSRRKLRS